LKPTTADTLIRATIEGSKLISKNAFNAAERNWIDGLRRSILVEDL